MMELSEITLSKTLHYTVEKFITCIKNCFDAEEVDMKKLFCEVVKRSESIAHDLRSMAIYSCTTLEASDLLDMKAQLEKKIEDLVRNILKQDFVELALNGDEEYFILSENDLHNFLYSAAMADVTNFTPSSLKLGPSFSFQLPPITSIEATDGISMSPVNRSLSCFLSSTAFENSRMQLEEELLQLMRILDSGFSTSDLNNFNVATILKYENVDAVERKDIYSTDPLIQENAAESLTPSTDLDFGILEEFDSQDSDSFLSWEGCLGQFSFDHFHISEVNPAATLQNISEKEYQTYYSLLNPSDAISEDDMVHNILDLLIGIPSDTFRYDIHTRKFRMKSGVHLPSLSSDCTAQVVGKFIESGSNYYLLHKFSQDFVYASKGLVFKGLQLGVQQILSMYKEYIASVKVSSPNMLFLRNTVLQNAEMMQTFGTICGIETEKMIFNEIPKGLGLLSYLHNVACSHKRKEHGIMTSVLLKFTYAPYFSFLNTWMTEGICDDPYGEFQIMEDFNYLGRRDAMYWKFAYTENIDDVTRAVPPEIKNYSQGILDCGKSIGLLKICCPDNFTLKFLFCKPPPPLSMVYSLKAATCKLKESTEYMLLKEQAEETSKAEISEVSVEKFYTQCQKFVNEKVMRKMVQRRWNILLASEKTNSNVFRFDQMKQCHNFDYSPECIESLNISKKKCNSLHALNTESKDCNFSGKLISSIGLLFSSCGYIETNKNYESEIVAMNFSSDNIHKHLNMMSCTEVFSDNPLKSMHTRCTESFTVSEINTFNYIQSDCFPKQDSVKARHVENNVSVEQNDCRNISSKNAGHAKCKSKSLNMSCGNKNGSKSLNSFVEKLASLLVSEYGDSLDDVYSCIQVTSLQRLMMHNFNAVLKMRIHLVDRTIMKYIVKQLRLDLLLSSLRNIYFFQDESFSQSLCQQLFSLVMKCRTPREFANWAVLSEILQNAVSDSNQENNPFLSYINANIATMTDEMPPERTEFLRLFKIEFEVNWPLNIIVHQTCIRQYLKIFNTLLEIEFLCWLLGRIWRMLIMSSKELHLDDASQFREIMLNRFHMEQFIRIIRNSIHQHLQGPLWEHLQKNLSVEESSIDGLESIHMQYLEKALARCFLTAETHVLHELLSVMFRQIYKFCSAVFECKWRKNEETDQYETYVFNSLSLSVDTFKQYQRVFLKRIQKEALTKKCGRHWDKDYQDFLDTILDTEKNIP